MNVPVTVWFADSIRLSVFVAVPVLTKFVHVLDPDNVCVVPFNCNSLNVLFPVTCADPVNITL